MRRQLCFPIAATIISMLLNHVAPSESTARPNTSWIVSSNTSSSILGVRPKFLEETAINFGFSTMNCSAFLCMNDPVYFLSVSIRMDTTGNEIETLDRYPVESVWRAAPRPVRLGGSVNFTLDGDLILRDSDGSLIWSSGTSNSGAQLLELQSSGNLVIRSRSGVLLWQSFDHPTDALLPHQLLKPGMKLVATVSDSNKEPGQRFSLEVNRFSVVLRSDLPAYGELWKDDEISSLEFSSSGLQVRGKNSAIWNSETIGNVTDATGYQIVKIYPNGELLFTSRLFVRLNLSDVGGRVRLNSLFQETVLLPVCGFSWSSSSGDRCECLELKSRTDAIHAVSSGNRTECKLDEQLEPAGTCEDRDYDPSQHHLVEAKDYYRRNLFDRINVINVTASVCSTLCISNCSCNAVFFDKNTGACLQMPELGNLNRTRNPSSPSLLLSIKLRRSSAAARKLDLHRRRSDPAIVAIFTAVTIGILILALILWKKQMKTYFKNIGVSSPSGTGEVLRPFTYSEIYAATRGFGSKIGSGGFGSVYEGVLPDRSKVAVKQLESSNHGQRQFNAEVKVIGRIHHKNLIRLRGYCSRSPCYYLVYDYAANGSLENWIEKLDWNSKFRIVTEIAQGLSYLHEECSSKVLHLDIKPQNILLDDEFVVKIADFGLSRMIERGDLSAAMTMVRGTPGYMAPEWLQLRVSDKIDVYSFGIVVLEIATGLRALHTCVSCGTTPRFLAAWIFSNLRSGKLAEVLDLARIDAASRIEAELLLRIGLWCIQPDPRHRPGMVEVVKMLEGSIEVLDPPLPPAEPCSKIDTSLTLKILMEMIKQQPKREKGCFPGLIDKLT